uniref:Cadherin EGF LAG seven-pass G-type receptor 1 n=1 Tax=Sphaerodactylus townsendi TaxID=933632 RepID=A0ACB8FQD8_9SAUR
MPLRWPGAAWLLGLLGLLVPAPGWELRLAGGRGAGPGDLLLDLSLEPQWHCALDPARTARQLSEAVEVTRGGLVRRTAKRLSCASFARNPLPLHLRLESPRDGGLLSLRLVASLHGPGCPSVALERTPSRLVIFSVSHLPALLCPRGSPPSDGRRVISALAALTSFPQCQCPDGLPLACRAGREGCPQPPGENPLELLCYLRRTRGDLLVELGSVRKEVAGEERQEKLRVERSRDGPFGAESEAGWESSRHQNTRRLRSVNSPPQFKLPNYQVSIAENQPPGTRVITLEAYDPDDGEAGRLTYSMEAFFDKRSDDYFSIDPEKGVVVTSRSLDRETKDTHVLQVTAVDHGSPRPRSAITFLTVTVSDTNDHGPVFEQPEYRENIRENLEVGYEVLTIRATDEDAPDNANLFYRFLKPGVGEGVFEIDPHSGVVRTCAPVDREEISEYHLVVEANDQGKDPGPRSATVTVHIMVEDENDNSPQFSEKRYLVQIPEDTTINSQVLQVQASDRDRGSNAQVHYSIVSGNLKGQFYIHSFSGSIDLINPLDYETIREYNLRIKAQDGGRPPQINSSGMVSIQVLDVNDNAPIFVSTPFQATVLENVPLGYSVLHIQAVDADSGDNARLEYKLELFHPSAPVPPSWDAGFPFQINNSTGWIIVSAELDRETVESYHFGVEARDHGVPVMSSSASVSITVLDVNDNSPMFTEKVYQLRLNEDAAVGSSVLTLTAVDRDVNSVVTYQITSGNTRNRFAITSQSAGGLITLSLPLDYKQERQYVLTVTASDGTLFDTVQVFINVTDANTHRPVFQSSHYTVSVSEDKPIGTSIVTISATDEDTGENSRITYVLEDNIPQFCIDPDTGTITTLMELDYEDQAAYTLAITAHDNGIPQKSDTTYVEILILDANDNAPRFLRDRYQGAVFEDVPLSTSVLQVSATDRDSGQNGRLLYTFQGGDDGDGDFYIEATSGVIRTLRKLDRENVAVYSLRAFAVDRGIPPLKASVDIQVTVLDINDNPPVFERDEFDIFVKENSPVGSVVTRISAIDPDEGTNAQIMYQIVEGNIPEVFQLDLLNGDLTALMDLDYESQTEYVIVVQATSAPLVSRATVHIRLLDQNDNAPVLQDFQILFNNYVTNKSNSFPSGVIGKIPAHDPDVSDKLNYTFVKGNELNMLLLDSSTGELKLSRDLDNNRPLEAIMEVSVSGQGELITALLHGITIV